MNIVNLNKLWMFDIGDNELTRLPTRWLPAKLQQLYIMNNQIANLSMNTFYGAFRLNLLILSLNTINIEYNTFVRFYRLSRIVVQPGPVAICSCKYIWYLNVRKCITTVCDNSHNKYSSITKYLMAECKEHIPG